MNNLDAEKILAEFLEKNQGQIRLAPLTTNIPQLISALANEEMDAGQIADVIYQYPIISARLLSLANSAWVSPPAPITHLEAACLRLGNSLIKAVSIAVAVASAFNTARCPSFTPIRYWASSMLVAEGSSLLFRQLPDKNIYATNLEQTLRTGGILHNIGLLWLADNLAEETEQALKASLSTPQLEVNQALKMGIGIDYTHIGAWIGREWNLPQELIDMIAHHRPPQPPETQTPPVILVGAAAKMVSALFHQLPEVDENPHLARLGMSFAQQQAVFTQLGNKLESTTNLAKNLL